MKKKSYALCLMFLFIANSVKASGFPVVDLSNLIQSIQQVLNQINDASKQAQQVAEQVKTVQELIELNELKRIGNEWLGNAAEVSFDLSKLDYKEIIDLLLRPTPTISAEEQERFNELYGTLDEATHKGISPEDAYKKFKELEKNIGHYNKDIVEATLQKSEDLQGRMAELAVQLNIADDLAEIEKKRGAIDLHYYQTQFLYQQENLRYRQIMAEFVLQQSFDAKERQRVKERHNYSEEEQDKIFQESFDQDTPDQIKDKFNLQDLGNE